MSAAKTTPAGIYAAMSAVMAEVGYAQKTGKATFGDKYTYASEGDLIAALRPAMVAQGLSLHVCHVDRFDVEHFDTKSGGKQLRCDVVVTYTMGHAASGETLTIQSIGTGVDSGDKAPYKAMTGALKYALRQSFIIETGNDPDASDGGHQEPPQQRREPAEQQRQQEAPAAPYRWSAVEQKRFCAALNDAGLDYDLFAAATERAGYHRPSAWSADRQQRALDQVKARSGLVWDAWRAYMDADHGAGNPDPITNGDSANPRSK